MQTSPHLPVLVQEILTGLQCDQGGLFLDCTVGCGGHAEAILTQHSDNRVIGLDRDAAALTIARQRLARFGDRFTAYQQRFEDLQAMVDRLPETTTSQRTCFDGILFDLGVSSLQLDDPARGFSFQTPGPLDMRMDATRAGTRTAAEIINTRSCEQLTQLFFEYGEERHARRIARRIVETRTAKPLTTTTELADLVAQAIPRRFHPRHIHPATRVFQAIRIEVNDELRGLGQTLEEAVQALCAGGRLGVIAFHSLEDRIIKQTFRQLAKGCQCPPDFPECVCGKRPVIKRISRKPMMAADAEKQRNPRARSAKLRIVQKL